jgi:nitrile hydratase accessory protein
MPLNPTSPAFEDIEHEVAPVNTAVPSGAPIAAEAATFREPWEAQAFAITLSLEARGLFTWSEWTATLTEEIKAAQAAGDPDTGATFYRHWLAALERLVAEKGLATHQQLARTQEAWERAAQRTAHGSPVRLESADFGPT